MICCFRYNRNKETKTLKSAKMPTVSRWSSFSDPISQMSYEIKEKIAFWNGNNFIGNLDK